MLIVLADDEPLIRMNMALALDDAGFQVMEAGNAADALAMLEARPGSIAGLVTDVSMPGKMDGIDLAKLATGRWPMMAVVVVSGRPLPVASDLPSNSRFLAKPYDPVSVVEHLRAMIASIH